MTSPPPEIETAQHQKPQLLLTPPHPWPPYHLTLNRLFNALTGAMKPPRQTTAPQASQHMPITPTHLHLGLLHHFVPYSFFTPFAGVYEAAHANHSTTTHIHNNPPTCTLASSITSRAALFLQNLRRGQ
jgi:hypothetical protein